MTTIRASDSATVNLYGATFEKTGGGASLSAQGDGVINVYLREYEVVADDLFKDFLLWSFTRRFRNQQGAAERGSIRIAKRKNCIARDPGTRFACLANCRRVLSSVVCTTATTNVRRRPAGAE